MAAETYGGEEMPWVEEEERDDKPQDVRWEEGYDEGEKQLIMHDVRCFECMVFCLDLDWSNSDEDRREDQVEHDSDPEVHHGHVEFVGSLRPISQSEDEAC